MNVPPLPLGIWRRVLGMHAPRAKSIHLLKRGALFLFQDLGATHSTLAVNLEGPEAS